MTMQQTLRSVQIHPPSVRAETINVIKAALAIVLMVAAYIFRPSFASQSANLQSRQSQYGLLPYQQLIRDAPPNEQRLFRELREGLVEAERIRAQTGRWPDVAALEAQGIPPFARDPTQKIAYTWTSVRQDWATNYLGVPSDRSQPAWVLVILEPEPGMPPDPAPNDETHHRLTDGTTLHVSIWNISEEKRRSGFGKVRSEHERGRGPVRHQAAQE